MKIGASSLTVGGLATNVSAGGSSPDDDPVVETEQLRYYKSLRLLSDARRSKPVNELVEFLNEQKQASVDYFDVEGHRVSYRNGPKHIVLNTPLNHRNDNDAKMSVLLSDEDAVLAGASASIEGQVFKSNPDIIRSDIQSGDSVEAAAAGDDSDYDVVDAVEWEKHNYSAGEAGIMSAECENKATFDIGEPAPRWVCEALAAAGTAIGSIGAVLVLVPEPGSTAVGLVTIGAVSAVAGSSCVFADIIEDNVDGYDPRKLTYCMKYDCSGWVCKPKFIFYLGDH